MNKRTLIATAAALFAAGTIASVASAQSSIHCGGTNACKGQSACKGGATACKGQNACKGQGFTPAKDAAECSTKGGKVVP